MKNTETVKITTPTELAIAMTRVFDAPRSLVFEAWTNPEHVPRWMLALGTGPAGAAVRALAWMGPTHAGKSLAALRRTLTPSEWHILTSSRAALPSWMATKAMPATAATVRGAWSAPSAPARRSASSITTAR